MKKISTLQTFGNGIFKEGKLTIGVDLGDRWSSCCVLDEAGEIILEQKVATTPEAMKQAFEKIPRSLMALETGTHSPWLSRLLRELGHQVLVAHAQKVQLITKSSRKDDRHDARTLARLARIDPELLGPVGGDRGGLAQWKQFGKRRNKEEERKNARKRLTLTGLLMEGLMPVWQSYQRLPRAHSGKDVRIANRAGQGFPDSQPEKAFLLQGFHYANQRPASCRRRM